MINTYNILVKGWKYFDIMHKDRKVARIYENGKCTIYYSSFLPYNIYLENGNDIDVKTNNLVNFYYWCSSRVLTLDRKYVKEILNTLGATQATTDKDRAAIAIAYHGLSLLDVYWIRSKDEKRTFAELSIYRHSLSNAFIDLCLRGRSITANNSELYESRNQAADLNTPGVAPKAWVRKDNKFYLLKDGDLRDVEAELLASKIINCFNVKSVLYEEELFQNIKVSKSSLITSEDISIVPVEAIDIYCINKDINTFEYIIKKDKYNYYMMNIIDYLIGNIDRHWNNWGFYVDNKKNKLLNLYPLMDFNKAFLAYDSIDGSLCLPINSLTNKRISQKDAAIEAVKKVGLNQIEEIDLKWFKDEKIKKMFLARLELLKSIK